jgi:hypothetical protein
LSFVAGFLLLDLLRYLVHRCKHAVPFFWRFHALHHSDPDVDVTTSVRLHPIEHLFSSGVFWLAVILLDIPAAVGLSYGLAVLKPSSTAIFAFLSGWSSGCSRFWSRSICTASTTRSNSHARELELRRRLIDLGSTFGDSNPDDAGSMRRSSFLKIAANSERRSPPR